VSERRALIHYRRLPTDEQTYRQPIVHESDDVIVSLTDPLVIEHRPPADTGPMLETGSRVLWFTFAGRWHDVGRFHAADGTFRGFYTNVLTPPRIARSRDVTTWTTTDLFVDVWCPVSGGVMLLDEDELADALAREHIDVELARRARGEADWLAGLADSGEWPPRIAREWTLERALAALAD